MKGEIYRQKESKINFGLSYQKKKLLNFNFYRKMFERKFETLNSKKVTTNRKDF